MIFGFGCLRNGFGCLIKEKKIEKEESRPKKGKKRSGERIKQVHIFMSTLVLSHLELES